VGVINPSDPDSRVMRTQGTPPRQAYNAQAPVNDRQVILAAEISIAAPDFGHLGRMLDTTLGTLRGRGVTQTPQVVLADAGYWHTAQMRQIAEQGIEVLARRKHARGTQPGWEEGIYGQMREKLISERGRKLYAQRKITIELSGGWSPRLTIAARSTATGWPTAPDTSGRSGDSRGRANVKPGPLTLCAYFPTSL
jgi:hypothetical protein